MPVRLVKNLKMLAEMIYVLAGAEKNSKNATGSKFMKTLKSRHYLAEEIIAGRKTVTWRLFDDKDLKVGDKVELLYWETKKKFSNAEIINVYEKRLGEIEEKDFEGHEKFESRDEMIGTYKKYYGDKVDWNTAVKIIKFKLL